VIRQHVCSAKSPPLRTAPTPGPSLHPTLKWQKTTTQKNRTKAGLKTPQQGLYPHFPRTTVLNTVSQQMPTQDKAHKTDKRQQKDTPKHPIPPANCGISFFSQPKISRCPVSSRCRLFNEGRACRPSQFQRPCLAHLHPRSHHRRTPTKQNTTTKHNKKIRSTMSEHGKFTRAGPMPKKYTAPTTQNNNLKKTTTYQAKTPTSRCKNKRKQTQYRITFVKTPLATIHSYESSPPRSEVLAGAGQIGGLEGSILSKVSTSSQVKRTTTTNKLTEIHKTINRRSHKSPTKKKHIDKMRI